MYFIKTKISRIFIFLVVVLISDSCRKPLKNINDYLPTVNTVTAELQDDGSVLVTGQVESNGYASIEDVGFTCSSSPELNLLSRQQISLLNGTAFTSTYSGGFDKDSTYYFTSWATNKYGYKFGTTVELSHIMSPAPPCTLTSSSLDLGYTGGNTYYYKVDTPRFSFQDWTLTASSAMGPVYFKFGSYSDKVVPGIYTTVAYDSPNNREVFIYFTLGGFTNYYVNKGSSVYVNKLAKDTFEITVCEAPWKFNATNSFVLKSRFITPS